MALSLDNINKARAAGYDDDTIIDSIQRRDPEFGARIKKAREAGYDSKTIIGSIEKRLSSPEIPDNSQAAEQPGVAPQVSGNTEGLVPPEQQAAAATTPETPAQKLVDVATSSVGEAAPLSSPKKPSESKVSYLDFFKKGFQGSASGELAAIGKKSPEQIGEDPGFWEALVQEAGTIAGDAPYMLAGSALGGATGATLGAPGGPIGSAAGGLLGGGFGAFAFPEFIKSALREYKDYTEKGNDLTFGEFLQRADKVASKTLNSGLMGSILGLVNKAAPLLKNIPGIGKLFTSKIGQKAGAIAAETGTLVGVPALAEGKIPEAKDFAHALALVVGFNVLKLPAALKEKIQKRGEASGLTPEEFAKTPEAQELIKEEMPNEKVSEKSEAPVERKEAEADQKVEAPKEKIKPVHEMNQAEAENAIKLSDEYDRKIIEPVVGKETFDKEYTNRGFEGQRRFWDKYENKFTEEQIDALERNPYPIIDELKNWVQKNKDYRTSYFSVDKNKGVREVAEDLLSPLIGIHKPSNQSLVKNAVGFLQSEGHTIKEISKEFEDVIKGKLNHSDVDFILNDIIGVFNKNKKSEIGNPSVQKNIESLTAQIEKAETKGKTGKVKVLQKNLSIQKKKMLKAKPEEPAKPIIETTGKGAKQQIDIPKTYSEKFIEGVNDTVDAIKNPGRTLKNTGRAINENLFNFLAPIERLEKDIPADQQVSSRIKLAQSSTSTINSVIENGIFSDVGTRVEHGGLKEAYGDYTWSRLTRKMKKPENYSIEELDIYRTSKQALKRQKEGKVTGIDTKLAQKDVHDLAPKYQEVDKQIREYNKAVLSHFGKDLLGQELIDKWNSDYHSSMYRLMDSGEGSMLAAGSLQPKQGFFKFKGSKRKILPTSESDVYNTALLIQNSKKNDAVLQYKKNVERGLLPGKLRGSKAATMPEAVGEGIELPDDLKPVAETLYGQTRADSFTPSKTTIRGWENGKAFEIEVPEEVVEVFKGMQPIQQGQIAKILTSANRAFSKGLTLDPRKFFSIWGRDALSAMIYSKSGVMPMDTAKATAEILGNSDLYKQFKFDGGDLYAGRLASRIDRAKSLEELVTPGKPGTIVPLDKLYSYFKKYEKKLGDISLAVPFAEYKAALQKYGNTAEGRILAMMDAKKVTYDPNRKGKSVLVREMAPFINFWNVTLQDLAMVSSQLKRPEVWARGIASITLPTLALKMWNEGNPEYDDLTAIDKAAFWHLYFGDHHLRIPAPWLLGTVFKTIPETLYETMKGRGGEGAKGLYHNAVDQISGNFNPLIQTSIEVMTGKSPASPLGFLLGVESKAPEVTPRRLQGLPKELQFTSNTSQVSRFLAPMIGASPVVMDRVISNLTANLGKDALALMDEIAYQTGLAEDKRPDKQLSNYLVLGNFVSNSPPSRTKYAEEFYSKLELLRVGKAGEKHGVPSKDVKKLQNANLTQYNTQINKKFVRYRDIQESNMSPKMKKQELDKTQKEINALYKEAVEKANR